MIAPAAPLALIASGAKSGGAGAAFYVVFTVFVVAFLVLVVLTLRWAVRRDRARRPQWLDRRRRMGEGSGPSPGHAEPVSPQRTNGNAPRRPGPRGREREQPG